MADTKIKVTDNISITIGDGTGIYAELPALLARLIESAEAMGVETAMGAALTLSKAIMERYAAYDGKRWICQYCYREAETVDAIPHRDGCEVLMAQALAKAGQQ